MVHTRWDDVLSNFYYWLAYTFSQIVCRPGDDEQVQHAWQYQRKELSDHVQRLILNIITEMFIS